MKGMFTSSQQKEVRQENEAMFDNAHIRKQENARQTMARQEDFINQNQEVPLKKQFPPRQDYMFGGNNTPVIVLDQIPHKMRANHKQESARVMMETRVIQNLIHSYFELTKKNIADLIPKTIMCFLVEQSKTTAHQELVECIYKGGNFD